MTRFSIPDMSCGHCKASVEAALAPMATSVQVDLQARNVTISGESDVAAILAKLQDIGFPAEILAS